MYTTPVLVLNKFLNNPSNEICPDQCRTSPQKLVYKLELHIEILSNDISSSTINSKDKLSETILSHRAVDVVL